LERPILFNTEMVKAILEGRKTQTRRIIKPQPTQKIDSKEIWFNSGKSLDKPPCKVGDTIWVRETWQESECFDFAVKGGYAYLANEFEYELSQEYQIKWRPSIHMPRKAARLFLKVTNVRCERLQEITNSDIRAEGAAEFGCVTHRLNFQNLWDSIYAPKGYGFGNEHTYGWLENPWVWVIEFERMV